MEGKSSTEKAVDIFLQGVIKKMKTQNGQNKNRNKQPKKIPDKNKIIGMRIAFARRMTGYKNQQQFADALNIPKIRLAKWEAGLAIPTIYELKEVSELTGYSLDYFFKQGDI